MRHELSGGHWVELRDPMEVTERERRPLRKAQMAFARTLRPAKARGAEVVDSPDPTAGPEEPELEDDARLDAIDEYTHHLMAFFVTAWDFDYPCTPETVQGIPAVVYTEIDNLLSPLAAELIFGIKPKPEETEESNPSEP